MWRSDAAKRVAPAVLGVRTLGWTSEPPRGALQTRLFSWALRVSTLFIYFCIENFIEITVQIYLHADVRTDTVHFIQFLLVFCEYISWCIVIYSHRLRNSVLQVPCYEYQEGGNESNEHVYLGKWSNWIQLLRWSLVIKACGLPWNRTQTDRHAAWILPAKPVISRLPTEDHRQVRPLDREPTWSSLLYKVRMPWVFSMIKSWLKHFPPLCNFAS